MLLPPETVVSLGFPHPHHVIFSIAEMKSAAATGLAPTTEAKAQTCASERWPKRSTNCSSSSCTSPVSQWRHQEIYLAGPPWVEADFGSVLFLQRKSAKGHHETISSLFSLWSLPPPMQLYKIMPGCFQSIWLQFYPSAGHTISINAHL